MSNWDDLRFFAALARLGSLSAAARALQTDHTTVARRIAALEARLGVKLFDRLPRGYALTDEGAALTARLGAVEDAVLAFERQAGGAGQEIRGVVRLGAPPAFGSQWLMPRLAPLLDRHPGLVLDLSVANAVTNLSRREVDLSLRLYRPEDRGLVARHVGRLTYGLYGRRDYVARGDDWRYIGYDGELADVPQQCWLRELAGAAGIGLMTNDLTAMLAALRAGMGVAVVPHVLAEGDELVCLRDGPEATRDLWLVVHPDMRRSPRVRAVMDALVEVTAPLRAITSR
ncbi:LysR family transcriptional regulator [Zavarzinia sp.]|uniref:LysR family transcriptional regulator n=1 Tax=Zavarzinia sp. TaxID=2027920 RepID=UPI003BB75BBE